MSLTKATYSMIANGLLNLKDYGAVGDGVANDTQAWVDFIADCISQNRKGYVPAGTYMIDSFTFDADASGLMLEGATIGRTAGSGAGFFGVAQTVLKLRTAATSFITIDGAYDLTINGISLNGNKICDNVLYYPGVANNTNTQWSNSEFCGATPTTGYIHRFDGSVGGESCSFYNCFLSASHNRQGADKVAACLYNSNTNAFLGTYTKCWFLDATRLVRFGSGSHSLIDCQFFGAVSNIIFIDSITQGFNIENCYNEGDANIPFFTQAGLSGVSIQQPITLKNNFLNSTNSDIVLNCQQPVNIRGGFVGGDIVVNPMATYGVFTNIVDSVGFNSGYGITGAGAITQTIQRGITVNLVPEPSKDYGAVPLAKYAQSINAGGTLAVTNESWINVANASPQNVTALTGGLVGQQVILYFSDANTTLVNSVGLKLQGSVNVTPTADSVITFIGSGAAAGLAPVYWSEVSRSIK